MERLQNLDGFQKGILLALLAMALVFSVVYPVTIAKEGILYRDILLVPSQEDGATVYQAEYEGKPICITVSADKAVTYRYADTSYGPYTVKEDASALPKEHKFREQMTGLEIRRGEETIFRGGMYGNMFVKENGEALSNITIMAGAEAETGNLLRKEPSLSAILYLMEGPKLTHKGDWRFFGLGIFVCLCGAVSVLYAQELFRWQMMFRVRSADLVEPSDWEIGKRYISWIVLAVVALIVFILGLR